MTELTTPIEIAIQANKDYQSVVRSQIDRVQARLIENQRHQGRLQELQLALNNGGGHKLTSERRRSLAIFTDSDNEHPEDNQDTISKAKMKDKMPLTYKVRKWTDAESKALANAIKKQNQDFLMDKANQRYLRSQQTPQDEEIHKKELEAIHVISPSELEASIDHINWEDIAQHHVQGRSAHECQIRWMNVDAPWISKQPWTAEEERRLKILAIQNHGHNWLLISQQLSQECGTNRTPTHCFDQIKMDRRRRSNSPGGCEVVRSEELGTGCKLSRRKNWTAVSSPLSENTLP